VHTPSRLPHRGGFLGSPCVPSPVSGIRTPNLPLLPVWEKRAGGDEGQKRTGIRSTSTTRRSLKRVASWGSAGVQRLRPNRARTWRAADDGVSDGDGSPGGCVVCHWTSRYCLNTVSFSHIGSARIDVTPSTTPPASRAGSTFQGKCRPAAAATQPSTPRPSAHSTA
jgi:hypothetical protein